MYVCPVGDAVASFAVDGGIELAGPARVLKIPGHNDLCTPLLSSPLLSSPLPSSPLLSTPLLPRLKLRLEMPASSGRTRGTGCTSAAAGIGLGRGDGLCASVPRGAGYRVHGGLGRGDGLQRLAQYGLDAPHRRREALR